MLRMLYLVKIKAIKKRKEVEWRKKGRKTSVGGRMDMNEIGLLKDFPYMLKEKVKYKKHKQEHKAYKTC